MLGVVLRLATNAFEAVRKPTLLAEWRGPLHARAGLLVLTSSGAYTLNIAVFGMQH